MSIETFEPTRLLTAYARIRSEHPHTALQAGIPDNTLLERVRKRLCLATEEQLASLAREFKPVELRALLHLLATDQEDMIRARAAVIARTRPRSDLLGLAWTLLSNNYPNAELEGVVRDLADVLGWSRTRVGPALEERLGRWFDAASLPGGLLDDFATDNTADLTLWLAGHGFEGNHGLAKAIWRTALCEADRALIERIGHDRMVARANGSVRSTQEAFARNYLGALVGRDHWQDGVLEWIQGKFAKPSSLAAGLTPFWRPVPETQRRQFRQWATAATLRAFFESAHDPYGRYAFWQTFLSHAEDAQMALGGWAVMIDFGTFGVVEFSEIGNAAYLYPRESFTDILRSARRATAPGELKLRAATLKSPHPGPNGDGRMLHARAWQQRYEPWIRTLLGLR